MVLVTTSSVRQADTALVRTALRALDGETVHVVATLPAGTAGIGDYAHRHANVTGFVPHAAVLDRAVCVVTHGGMGITQKALSRGIPVCAVPFGRDQFEVARRVELARCGTRLPARHLTASRLRDAVVAAMTMSAGRGRWPLGSKPPVECATVRTSSNSIVPPAAAGAGHRGTFVPSWR